MVQPTRLSNASGYEFSPCYCLVQRRCTIWASMDHYGAKRMARQTREGNYTPRDGDRVLGSRIRVVQRALDRGNRATWSRASRLLYISFCRDQPAVCRIQRVHLSSRPGLLTRRQFHDVTSCGIVPELEIPLDWNEYTGETDQQLQTALELVLTIEKD